MLIRIKKFTLTLSFQNQVVFEMRKSSTSAKLYLDPVSSRKLLKSSDMTSSNNDICYTEAIAKLEQNPKLMISSDIKPIRAAKVIEIPKSSGLQTICLLKSRILNKNYKTLVYKYVVRKARIHRITSNWNEKVFDVLSYQHPKLFPFRTL